MTDTASTETAERAAAAADWNQRIEALIAAATAGEPDLAARLDLLVPPADPTEGRRQLTAYLLVTLVNAGHYELARSYAATKGLWALATPPASGEAPGALIAGDADALYCLAVLDVQTGGDDERGLANFRRLQRLLPPDHHLQRHCADGEAVALARLGRNVEITWPSAANPGSTLAIPCPTCAGIAPKPEVCLVTANFPGRDAITRLLRCPDCNCIFLETLHELAYHEDTDMSGDALAFYVQQNAGIWPITRTLARVARPPGSRYIDVGCGFGFGLDFALHGLGWSGRGLDPSPLARCGAEQLNLPIEPRYFTAADAKPPADVVMASEVLEHVAAPREFIAMLRQAVAPGGLLIVTTPDGDAVRPNAPSSVLLPVLSIGAHLVLQSATSLERLLRDAGLPHVVVERDSPALIAYASDRPFTLDYDQTRLRATYRSYLRTRMASSPRGSDLWLGFAARAFRESVIDMDTTTTDTAALADELRQRYNIDLDNPGTLPELTGGMSTEQLRTVAPFSVADLLYLHAIQRCQAGDQTAPIGEIFFAAARTARAVRAVLAKMNADDPVVAITEHDAAAQATLIAARRGSADALERLAFALASPDGVDRPPLRHLADATMAALIKAGAYRLAWRLRREFRGSVGPGGRLRIWLPWLLSRCAAAAWRALPRR